MRGRKPSGPEYVQTLEGSPEAKERLSVILETLADRCRVLEACDRLGIAETRFHRIRQAALQAAVTALEHRPAGRPPRSEPAGVNRVRELEAQVQALRLELRAAQVRAEINLVIPPRSEPAPAAGKKTTPRTRRATPP